MVADTDERSVQDGSPIELFEFIGTYNTYRLTNRDVEVVNSNGTYSPGFAIRRTNVESGTQEDSDITVDVSIDISHPIVAEYAINEPPPSLQLRIFRVHPSDLNDTILVWDGEVISWSISGRVATARAPSLFSYLLDSPLPRPKYQAPCNHRLGDSRCGVDLTTPENSHTTFITDISGNMVTVDSNPFTNDDLPGGEFIAPSERRQISSATGLVIQISSPLSPAVSVNDAVTLRRGCDHALNGHCTNRYNNFLNFSGDDRVPPKNPYEGRI